MKKCCDKNFLFRERCTCVVDGAVVDDQLMKNLKGHCTCKEVSYRLIREPMFVHCCHCTWCQRETGSAFVLNALIESENVEILAGAPEKVMIPTESGKGQQVWRCPKCKIALWSNYGGAKDFMRFVRIGTFEQPRDFTPDVHIFTRSKLPWVDLPKEAKAFDVYYDAATVWPAESLERRNAVVAKLRGK
jgi:hypothetical protein